MSLSDQSAATLATSAANLPPLPSGWQPICYAVLADETMAVLGADVDLAGEHLRIRAALQASVSPNPPSRLVELGITGTARIWTIAGGCWAEGPKFPLETPFPQLDRFSDDSWLVVGSRSRGGPNARRLAPNGILVDRFTLGDGIEYVGIDAEDRIWVGWFDEGIGGNENWRVPGHEWAPSSNGLALFAADGSLLLLPIWPAEPGAIADCNSLNVVGRSAWACAYEDFPLVHFLPGAPARWWRSGHLGPSAIAVDGSHVLLAGGYTEEANRLALLHLEGAGLGEHASVLATWALPLRRLPPPANEWAPVWHRPTLLAGRGDTLHLIDDGVWYRWRVRDLVAMA